MQFTVKVNVLVGCKDNALVYLVVPCFSLIAKSEASFSVFYCLLIEQVAQITNLQITVNKI